MHTYIGHSLYRLQLSMLTEKRANVRRIFIDPGIQHKHIYTDVYIKRHLMTSAISVSSNND